MTSHETNCRMYIPKTIAANTTTQEIMDSKIDRQKVLLVAFASGSIFLYAGAFYGWGPMQLLLENNGNYQKECDTEVVCEEQTSALLTVRFASQLTILLAPVLGFLSDRQGAHALTLLMTFLVFLGLVLLTMAAAYENILDGLLFPSFLCLGLAATCGSLLTVETGMVFTHPQTRSRVISALNAFYDAGAITYLGLWGISETTSGGTTSLTRLTVGYLCVSVLCLGGYSYYFWVVVAKQRQAKTTRIIAEESLPPFTILEGLSYEYINVSTVDDRKLDSVNEEGQVVSLWGGGDKGSLMADDDPASDNALQELVATADAAKEEDYIVIARRTVPEQLKSQPYILLCIYFAFHAVSSVWTLTTARDFLKDLGDDEYGNRYLAIFTLLTPASLCALPFVDVAMHRFGFHLALQVVNVLALAHGIIKVTASSTNLNVQILGFLLFSFFRCFFFAAVFSCLASFVSATGRAVGLFFVAAGIFSFVNIPLTTLAVERQDGDFFLPNLMFAVLNIPMFFVTWVFGQGLDKNRKHIMVGDRASRIS